VSASRAAHAIIASEQDVSAGGFGRSHMQGIRCFETQRLQLRSPSVDRFVQGNYIVLLGQKLADAALTLRISDGVDSISAMRDETA
jgi:hypothetical protein